MDVKRTGVPDDGSAAVVLVRVWIPLRSERVVSSSTVGLASTRRTEVEAFRIQVTTSENCDVCSSACQKGAGEAMSLTRERPGFDLGVNISCGR